MSTFASLGLSFSLDRSGAEIPGPAMIEGELPYEDLRLEPELAAEQLGERLSALLGEEIADEEGIFDLVASKGDQIVAAVVLSCEEEGVSIGGERSASVSDAELAGALGAALGAG